MPTSSDIKWFKEKFQSRIEQAVHGTPLTVDFITALACQETGHIWPRLVRQGLTVERVLELCVGDCIDGDGETGRSAFPRDKAELLANPKGEEMFLLGHAVLGEMAQYIHGYQTHAEKEHKFCRGYGIFQYDLQHFKSDPDYFLHKKYTDFDACLAKCMGVLVAGIKKLGFTHRVSLSDEELARIGIVYNTGTFKAPRGLKQGYFDGKRYYGEALLDFIRLTHTVHAGEEAALSFHPTSGHAIMAPPSGPTQQGVPMVVDTLEGMLNVRSTPAISKPPNKNVLACLPDGHPILAVNQAEGSEWVQIETNLKGALIRGYVSAKFVKAAPEDAQVTVETPAQPALRTGITAVYMPRREGVITTRKSPAGAHSLNEPGQPVRNSSSAQGLREDMMAIAEWLDVDNPQHLRYQPKEGRTFCNVYAHDFCTLAGVYLPRVWWSSKALLKLTDGQKVTPLIGDTITELRANDLFRWLNDFGLDFGWRRTGTLSKLQTEVNQGAVGVIVARRKQEGRAGHITVVLPETGELVARRNAAGEVTAPLQSQAGVSNFTCGTGRTGWWCSEEFAEYAFWIHA